MLPLWGKYPVQSIHGNQYFHSFLDDNTRRPTLRFLKHKTEAAQAMKNYVAYLEAHGHHPNAFCCDEGREFLTTDRRKMGLLSASTAHSSN